MPQHEQVYITGYSALSAGGHGVDQHWQALLQGQSCLSFLDAAEFQNCEPAIVGKIEHFNWAQALPDRKLLKLISRHDVMGLYAAIQAMQHAQLQDYLLQEGQQNAEIGERTAIFVGSPGNKYYQQYDFLPLISASQGDMQYFAEHLFEQVHPMWLLRILPNNVLAYAGILLGCKGVNHNFTNHIIGGMQALVEAYWSIKTGQADRAVVVAYDLGYEAQARYYYEHLGIVSKQALRPFDALQDGTVLGEGAAALVLESGSSMKLRQVKPLVEFLGGQVRTEGCGLFSLEGDGHPLATLMQEILARLQLYSYDMQFLVAHGNGNPKSDDSEAQAIRAVFGDRGIPVTAFKWLMGHTLCASGVLDVVLTVKALLEQTIPGLMNAQSVDRTNLDLVTTARPLQGKNPHAMVLNRGFGSMNAAVVLRAEC